MARKTASTRLRMEMVLRAALPPPGKRTVPDDFNLFHGPAHGLRVRYVTAMDLDPEFLQFGRVARRPGDSTHRPPARQAGPRHVAADEAGSACDQVPHSRVVIRPNFSRF